MRDMTVTYVRTQRQALERKLTEVINQAISKFEDDTEMTIESITIDLGSYARKDGMTGAEVDRIMAKVVI
jgi:hypothetical protein